MDTTCSTGGRIGHRRASCVRPALGGLLVTALCWGLFPTAGKGQEIQWRHDYDAARREAEQKHLPLFLDFGTLNCFWCKKLDMSTFRDPSIAGILNQRFIPVKVEADRDVVLTEALHIQSFPTLVLAAPDGKILDTHEGYLEAPNLQDHLQRVLVALTPPPPPPPGPRIQPPGTPAVMVRAQPASPPAVVARAQPVSTPPLAARAQPISTPAVVVVAQPPVDPPELVRDYVEAGKAIAAADYARGFALLRGVVADGKQRPVQVKAQQMLRDLEQQAADRLVRAKQLQDKGETAQAIAALTELLQRFAGSQAANQGGQMLTSLASRPGPKVQERAGRAREILAQAREEYRSQQYLLCMDHCEVLAAGYGDLPEGTEAIQLAGEIKNNPEWIEQACLSLSDRLGQLYLSQAETWLKKGQPQQALNCLEHVVQSFPGSPPAELAMVRLAQVRGQPTQQTTFKK